MFEASSGENPDQWQEARVVMYVRTEMLLNELEELMNFGADQCKGVCFAGD